MNARSSLLPAILLGAAGLGILGDAVFHDSPFGLNLPIWGGAFLLFVAFLNVRFERSLTRLQSGLLLTAQAGALGLTLHDSAFLHFLDLSVMLVASLSVVWIAKGGTIFAAGVATYVIQLLQNGIGVFFQALLLLADESHLEGPIRDWMTRVDFTKTFRILLGCLLALPFLLVFGALFASADTVFRDLVSWLVDFDLTVFLKHLTITGICGWIAAGYLIRLLLSDVDPTPPALPEDGRRSIGAVEIPVILTLLTCLFATFVFVQIQYLFGNSSLVQLTPGLTYADYARRGFFELVTVAALVLPMLLIGDWFLGEDSDKRWFRRLSTAVIVLLLVIMASATKRMFLYVGEYGLTETRLYVFAAMLWLALVFFWFAGTVLRQRRGAFMAGALAAGLVIIAGLHAINPERTIATTNLARQQEGKRFDAKYLTTLSADAIPVIVEKLNGLPEADQSLLRTHLRRYVARWNPDWRSWNHSRSTAADLIARKVAITPIAKTELAPPGENPSSLLAGKGDRY